jgi:hypothetical protein
LNFYISCPIKTPIPAETGKAEGVKAGANGIHYTIITQKGKCENESRSSGKTTGAFLLPGY